MALNADKAYLLILIPIIIAAAVFIIKKEIVKGSRYTWVSTVIRIITASFLITVSYTHLYKLEQRFELLNYTGDIWNDNNLEFEVNLYAYTENSLLDGARTINGKEVNENWENLYKKSVPVDISKSTNYDIPEGYLVPTEIYLGNINDTSSMDIYNFEIYTMTSDTIECIYDLGQCNSIREIGITWDNYDGFRNEPLIYNNVTGRYESLKTADIKNNVGACLLYTSKIKKQHQI